MIDPLYVAARAVLLDALEGLGPQRDAVILAGAQATYVHTGSADLSIGVSLGVLPYTFADGGMRQG